MPGYSLAGYTKRSRGDCHPDDAALNQQALLDGSRLMSVYRLVAPEVLAATPRERQQDLPTVWIITEAVGEDGNRALHGAPWVVVEAGFSLVILVSFLYR